MQVVAVQALFKYFHYKRRERMPSSCRNAIFVVVSDDLVWSRYHLSAKDVIFPGNQDIKRPEVDYIIITLCHHHIVGSGTFGATSALLGPGSIVQYSQWFKGSLPLSNYFNCKSSSNFYRLGNYQILLIIFTNIRCPEGSHIMWYKRRFDP
ncbi:Galactoside 2-alpha-L-fucosyltransferase 2 [Armadillidium vulgare]|nr:Galactoside 2-alpha-L-fucosyltransferase 2 [Armadillidium vulgare]